MSLRRAFPRRPTRRRSPEREFNIAAQHHLRTVLQPPGLAFHIPNGGKRSRVEGALLKAMGVTAGVPDQCVLWDGPGVGFLEMKAKDGRLSDEQHEIIERLQAMGVNVAVVKTLDDIDKALSQWGVPVRAVIRA